MAAPPRRPRSHARLTFPGVMRGEWIKLLSLRSTWWTLGITVVLMTLIGLAGAASLGMMAEDPEGRSDARQMHGAEVATSGYQLGMVTVAVLGALLITGEYSTGMIRSTLAAVPARLPVLAAKAIALTVLTVVVSVLGLALSYLVTDARSSPTTTSCRRSTTPRPGRSSAARCSSSSPPPCSPSASGTLLRSTAGAITGSLVVLFLLPVILQFIQIDWVQDVVSFLPMPAANGVPLRQRHLRQQRPALPVAGRGRGRPPTRSSPWPPPRWCCAAGTPDPTVALTTRLRRRVQLDDDGGGVTAPPGAKEDGAAPLAPPAAREEDADPALRAGPVTRFMRRHPWWVDGTLAALYAAFSVTDFLVERDLGITRPLSTLVLVAVFTVLLLLRRRAGVLGALVVAVAVPLHRLVVLGPAPDRLSDDLLAGHDHRRRRHHRRQLLRPQHPGAVPLRRRRLPDAPDDLAHPRRLPAPPWPPASWPSETRASSRPRSSAPPRCCSWPCSSACRSAPAASGCSSSRSAPASSPSSATSASRSRCRAERARIAREMHDVVAHSLAVMITLAEGASASLTRRPEQARLALDELAETGRRALADTRRLVGVLREDARRPPRRPGRRRWRRSRARTTWPTSSSGSGSPGCRCG